MKPIDSQGILEEKKKVISNIIYNGKSKQSD